jgi:transposase-like protein
MVLDHEADHPSRWATVTLIAKKIGYSAHTLLEWVKKAEVDSGKRAGVPTELANRLNALERDGHQKAAGVGHDMALAALHLLARVIARNPATFCSFDRLAVDEARAGRSLASQPAGARSSPAGD